MSTITNSNEGSPEAWARKVEVDLESGEVVLRSHTAHNQIELTQGEDGKMVGYIHGLAKGVEAARGSTSYVTTTEDLKSLNAIGVDLTENGDGKAEIRTAKYYWREDPLVFKCITFLQQLSNSKLTIECEDEGFQEILREWVKAAVSFTFREQWFLEFFRSGMVPVFKSLIPYVPRDYNPNKMPKPKNGNIERRQPASASASKTRSLVEGHKEREREFREALAQYENAHLSMDHGIARRERVDLMYSRVIEKQYRWMQGMIPGAYTILDPLSITIKGPPELAWLRMPFLSVGGELRHAIMNPSSAQIDTVNSLPVEIVQQIKNGAVEVWLSPNIASIIYGYRQPYEKYPTPLTRPAFRWLRIKHKMAAMDEETIETLQNRILLVKVGSDNYPVFDHALMTQVAGLLKSASRTKQLIWNHAIELEWIEPDTTSLLNDRKYNWIDDQIRTVYGISRILTGTSETSGAIGNSIMNFKGVEELATSAQGKFIEWLHHEIEMLKAALEIKHEVHIRFDNLNMTDPIKFMAVLNTAVSNGLLDPQTAMETLNYHFPTVKKRMEEFKELWNKGLFVPHAVKAQKETAELNAETSLKLAEQQKLLAPPEQRDGQGDPDKGGGTPTGGKPANSPLADNNDNKRGQSQPKMAAAASMTVLPDGRYAVVIDADIIDDEARAQVASIFSGDDNVAVLTRAEMKEITGEAPNFDPPLPSLDVADMVSAMREARQLVDQVNAEYETACEAFKSQGGESMKRGPYLTQERRTELLAQAKASVMAGYREKHLSEVNDEELTRRLNSQLVEVMANGQDAGGPSFEDEAIAMVSLSRRLQRARGNP